MGCCGSTEVIREGQRIAIWDKNGRCRMIDGPCRLKIGRQEITQYLTCYTCSETQYLTVTFLDGHKQRVRGPTAIWFDPTKHKDITVGNAIEIDASELMVVFSRVGRHEGTSTDDATFDETITPKIIKGPALHVPAVDEVVHEFKWHGSDPSRPERKIPGALKFTKLRHIPDQTYFTIPEVRTSDDAVLELMFMVFFELESIEKMMDKTHDPIADFMNSLTADIISFVSSLTYETFLEKTEMLNSLECYRQLTSRAKHIGFRVTKVAYRGYHSANLQQMHDDAIQARTQLRLEAETEAQAQQLADMKLVKENERQKKKQEMQKSDVEHNNLLSRMQHEEKLAQENRERELKISALKAENEEQLAYLAKLKAMGVDLTQYLTSQSPYSGKHIHISGDAGNPNVHVHADASKKKNV